MLVLQLLRLMLRVLLPCLLLLLLLLLPSLVSWMWMRSQCLVHVQLLLLLVLSLIPPRSSLARSHLLLQGPRP
jgi:hypothetical protein